LLSLPAALTSIAVDYGPGPDHVPSLESHGSAIREKLRNRRDGVFQISERHAQRVSKHAFQANLRTGAVAKLANNAWPVFQLAARTSWHDAGRNLQELAVWLIDDRDTAFRAAGAALLNRGSIVEDVVRRSY
jgi:hypothetical protein